MHEVRILTLLELRALFSFNRFRHAKDPKAKRRYRLLIAAWVLIGLMVVSYVAGLTYGLATLGLAELIPMYIALLSGVLVFAVGVFTAGNALLSPKGYDLLCAMPLKASSVVTARFFRLYIEGLLVSLAIFLPGLATYGACQQPAFSVYLTALTGCLFLPAIPTVISSAVGALVMGISSRMKHKSLVQTILMIAVVLGVVLLSAVAPELESLTSQQWVKIATQLGLHMRRMYPPAAWLGNAMTNHSLPLLALFISVSCLAAVAALWVIVRNHRRIMLRLASTHASQTYRVTGLKSRSLLKALYLREVKRYFSSSIYVTNTIIGPIMGCVLSIALLVVGMEPVTATIPLDVTSLLPFALAAVFSMMTTTSTALSMEGAQFWVVKSLPIPTKALLDSKLLLNLSLMLPFYLVSEVCLLIVANPSWTEALWLLLIPAALILFAVVFGIAVNLRFHSFDWEKEEAVVKQSDSAMLGGFAGMLAALLFGAAAAFVPAPWTNGIKAVICAVLLTLTAYLYHRSGQIRLETL